VRGTHKQIILIHLLIFHGVKAATNVLHSYILL